MAPRVVKDESVEAVAEKQPEPRKRKAQRKSRRKTPEPKETEPSEG
jgi:hypothetical protein